MHLMTWRAVDLKLTHPVTATGFLLSPPGVSTFSAWEAWSSSLRPPWVRSQLSTGQQAALTRLQNCMQGIESLSWRVVTDVLSMCSGGEIFQTYGLGPIAPALQEQRNRWIPSIY